MSLLTIGQEKTEEIFAQAGINVLTTSRDLRPFDIFVKDERFYIELLSKGSLGLGESYQKDYWDCASLEQMAHKAIGLLGTYSQDSLTDKVMRAIFNFQSKSRSSKDVPAHYDKGLDFFQAMLDERMVYSCAYWGTSYSLRQAQENKLKLLCEKLHLKSGQNILNIGCGFGAFEEYASKNYGVSVVGITLSQDQADYAKKLCANLPVEILLQDYRDVKGKFDHVVSVGMFEHVGPKNYRSFMDKVSSLLSDDGLFLLHTIGRNDFGDGIDPWINKHVFPGAVLPSMNQITMSVKDLFVVEDWHNFGYDYYPTLLSWWRNFQTNYSHLDQKKYPHMFYRTQDYYLRTCAGSFSSRYNQLWQVVLSKKGVSGGYPSIR